MGHVTVLNADHHSPSTCLPTSYHNGVETRPLPWPNSTAKPGDALFSTPARDAQLSSSGNSVLQRCCSKTGALAQHAWRKPTVCTTKAPVPLGPRRDCGKLQPLTSYLNRHVPLVHDVRVQLPTVVLLHHTRQPISAANSVDPGRPALRYGTGRIGAPRIALLLMRLGITPQHTKPCTCRTSSALSKNTCSPWRRRRRCHCAATNPPPHPPAAWRAPAARPRRA